VPRTRTRFRRHEKFPQKRRQLIIIIPPRPPSPPADAVQPKRSTLTHPSQRTRAPVRDRRRHATRQHLSPTAPEAQSPRHLVQDPPRVRQLRAKIRTLAPQTPILRARERLGATLSIAIPFRRRGVGFSRRERARGRAREHDATVM